MTDSVYFLHTGLVRAFVSCAPLDGLDGHAQRPLVVMRISPTPGKTRGITASVGRGTQGRHSNLTPRNTP